MQLAHIAKIERGSEPVGSILDFVYLMDGRFLCISEESIILYSSMSEFDEQRSDNSGIPRDLQLESIDAGISNHVMSAETMQTGGHVMVDQLLLTTGEWLCVSEDCAVLYQTCDQVDDFLMEVEESQVLNLL